MTVEELKIWLVRSDLEDAWWVKLDGEIAPELFTLKDISKVLDQDAVCVRVLHKKHPRSSTAGWLDLSTPRGIQARARARERRRQSKQVKIEHRRIVRQFVGLFCAAVIMFSIVCLNQFDLIEIWNRTPEISLDRADEYMGSEQSEAIIWAEVMLTDRILYVYNVSDFAWPSFRAYLNEADGYQFQSNSVLRPSAFLKIPLRDFKLGAESGEMDTFKISRVGIEVPGYRTLEKTPVRK